MLFYVNQENLEVSKDDHNSWKALQLMWSSANDVLTVSEDLARAFCKLFFNGFVFSVISEKTLSIKDFTGDLRDITSNIVANSL